MYSIDIKDLPWHSYWLDEFYLIINTSLYHILLVGSAIFYVCECIMLIWIYCIYVISLYCCEYIVFIWMCCYDMNIFYRLLMRALIHSFDPYYISVMFLFLYFNLFSFFTPFSYAVVVIIFFEFIMSYLRILFIYTAAIIAQVSQIVLVNDIHGNSADR